MGVIFRHSSSRRHGEHGLRNMSVFLAYRTQNKIDVLYVEHGVIQTETKHRKETKQRRSSWILGVLYRYTRYSQNRYLRQGQSRSSPNWSHRSSSLGTKAVSREIDQWPSDSLGYMAVYLDDLPMEGAKSWVGSRSFQFLDPLFDTTYLVRPELEVQVVLAESCLTNAEFD